MLLSKKVAVGINGFGRFGLRFFRHWLKSPYRANLYIRAINDPIRKIEDIADNIKRDEIIGKIPHTVEVAKNRIKVEDLDFIDVSRAASISDIPWHGEVEMVLEASGRFTERDLAAAHLRCGVRKVLISATSLSSDKTIILGVNHHEYDPREHHVISYGSCTVNAFVPVAKVLNDAFGITESNASVIHNTPLRDIAKPYGTIVRKGCTLEHSGPLLLPFLKGRFYVTYRMIPYPGVSLMDMSFHFAKKHSAKDVLEVLTEAASGAMDIHIAVDTDDKDANRYIGDPASAIIIASAIRKVGNRTLVSAWFDNENSAARFYDLANFVINKGM